MYLVQSRESEVAVVGDISYPMDSAQCRSGLSLSTQPCNFGIISSVELLPEGGYEGAMFPFLRPVA